MTSPVPNHYRLSIQPDLTTFKFRGNVEIVLNAQEPLEEVVLNALALEFQQCTVDTGDGHSPCEWTMDPDRETVCLRFSKALSGEFCVRLDYSGTINDQLAGFYRSSYTRGSEVRPLAVTQFEESSARMAFPCFDHPKYKATFEVILMVDAGLTAISNGDIVRETPEGEGMKRVVFETTPKMSTYLLFFGVGDFEWVQDEKDRRVRAAAVPGMTDGLGLGLDYGRKSLEFCEQYFGVPYPMSKLDLIAVPDFAFGAMENWGAVVFRENLLLYDPERTSQAGKERICVVIAHEIVHQWFGNLVSPSDWKYLWLNESFATFFENRILDHYSPEWHVWDQFLHNQTSLALVRDALWETIAIEIPGGDEHVVINAATAPIIYNKGGCILNQVCGHIGEERFKKGVNHFLKDNAYGCAESRHLWDAYGADGDTQVSRMMENWVSQPGFPVITVRKNGTELHLSQERFTYLTAEGGNFSSAVWPVPLGVKAFTDNSGSMQFDILMDKKEVLLHMGADVTALKLNAGQTGFYRVHYASEEMLVALGERVADKKLSAADRWGLQEDLFAMVRGGRDVPLRYLDFLEFYGEEEDFLPAVGIAGNLHLMYLVTTGAVQDRTAKVGARFLDGVLQRIGFDPEDGETNTTRMLRDAILFRAMMFGPDTAARAWGEKKFFFLLDGGSIHPDIQRSVLQMGAWLQPGDAFDWFTAHLKASGSEHERLNILMAMGCLSDETVIREALAYTLGHVPQRNRHLPLVSCAANPTAQPFLWGWFESNLTELETFHPLLLERVIDSLVPVCGLGREASVRDFFSEYISKKKTGEATIRIALEFLAVNSRMRNIGE